MRIPDRTLCRYAPWLIYLKCEISGQNSYTVSFCEGMVINPSISFYMPTKDSGIPSSRGMTIRYKTTFDHGTDDGLPMNCSSQLGSMAVIRSVSEFMIAGDSAAILQEQSHKAEEQVHRNAWAWKQPNLLGAVVLAGATVCFGDDLAWRNAECSMISERSHSKWRCRNLTLMWFLPDQHRSAFAGWTELSDDFQLCCVYIDASCRVTIPRLRIYTLSLRKFTPWGSMTFFGLSLPSLGSVTRLDSLKNRYCISTNTNKKQTFNLQSRHILNFSGERFLVSLVTSRWILSDQIRNSGGASAIGQRTPEDSGWRCMKLSQSWK